MVGYDPVKQTLPKSPGENERLADSGKTIVRIPVVRERAQVEVAIAVVAVDVGSVAAPDRAVFIQNSVRATTL